MATDLAALERELVAIKKLLLLALLKSGANQGELATAIGVSQPTLSRMLEGAGQAPKSAKKRR